MVLPALEKGITGLKPEMQPLYLKKSALYGLQSGKYQSPQHNHC